MSSGQRSLSLTASERTQLQQVLRHEVRGALRGLEGLADAPRSGRPPRVTAAYPEMRLERIRQAKAELEAEAKEARAELEAQKKQDGGDEPPSGPTPLPNHQVQSEEDGTRKPQAGATSPDPGVSWSDIPPRGHIATFTGQSLERTA